MGLEFIILCPLLIFLSPLIALTGMILPFFLCSKSKIFCCYTLLMLFYLPLLFLFPALFNSGIISVIAGIAICALLLVGWIQYGLQWLMPKGKRFPAKKH